MILELDEVTGIRMNQSKDKAIADIVFKLRETTPFVVLDSVKHESFKKEGLKTKVPFALYDVEWSLIKCLRGGFRDRLTAPRWQVWVSKSGFRLTYKRPLLG